MLGLGMIEQFDVAGAGGGGGGFGGGGNEPAADPNTAAPITFTKDTSFIPEGQKDPVKWGDWQAKYVDKSEFTKATQLAADRDRQWRAAYDDLQKRYQTAQQSGQPQPNAPQKGAFDEELNALSNATYVDGKTAAGLVKRLVTEGIGGLATSIKQRDQVIKLLYDQLQGVQTQVGSIKNASTEEARKGLYQSVRSSLKLPQDDVIQDFLEDVYLSHVGEDLNTEFPNLVSKRWTALVNAVRQYDKGQADEARRTASSTFGRGGNATPGAPAKKKGFESPEDIAKAWFPIMSRGSDT